MLARIADPSLRLAFTPKRVDLCTDVLGLDPETVLFTVDGVEHTVAAGQVLVMPAGKPHAVYAPRSFKMLLTVVFPRKE